MRSTAVERNPEQIFARKSLKIQRWGIRKPKIGGILWVSRKM